MNYYNECDLNAVAWLRELISAGLIPPGNVDERSIVDVCADDLRGYSQCHFFAGIGGWSLALKLAGWPEDRPVWTGSCPCQPYSAVGKQRGNADERDLWPVFFRLISERRPEFVFGEQVENAIRHGWLDRVYADMEGEGYAVGAAVLGEHSVGAPHRRYRLYWGGVRMADRICERLEGYSGNEKNRNQSGRNGTETTGSIAADGVSGVSPWRDSRLILCRDGKTRRVPVESIFLRMDDGIPTSVDGSWITGISEAGGFPVTTQKEGRVMLLRGYGNAVVPQVAAEFVKAFMEAAQ